MGRIRAPARSARRTGRAHQISLNLFPRAVLCPADLETLRSAATMLFTPSFHRRPVNLLVSGGRYYVVMEVAMTPAGEPLWVRCFEATETGAAMARWVYRWNNRAHGFDLREGDATYFYACDHHRAYDSAMVDAEHFSEEVVA